MINIKMTLIKLFIICLIAANLASAQEFDCANVAGDYNVANLDGFFTGALITLQQQGCQVSSSIGWVGTVQGDSLTYVQVSVIYHGEIDDGVIEFEDQFYLYPAHMGEPRGSVEFMLEKAFNILEDIIEDEQVTRDEVMNFLLLQNIDLNLGFDEAFILSKANPVFDVLEVETDSDDIISEYDILELRDTVLNSTAARYQLIEELINATRLTETEIEHVYSVLDRNGNGALNIADFTHYITTHFSETDLPDDFETEVNQLIKDYLGQSSFTLDEVKSLVNAGFDCAHSQLESLIDSLVDEEEADGEAEFNQFIECIQDQTGFTPKPTLEPSSVPTMGPTTSLPSSTPTDVPTFSSPTFQPSYFPTFSNPTEQPSSEPTDMPVTSTPTLQPTTDAPTFNPTKGPSSAPSRGPTTSIPTMTPSLQPTTEQPTLAPITSDPTDLPTMSPSTSIPTFAPVTSMPTVGPTTSNPTFVPSFGPTTSNPTLEPSLNPTFSTPTYMPTSSTPTRMPTDAPTTANPTFLPTSSPHTSQPSNKPTATDPTKSPTNAPSVSTPTSMPSESPVTSRPTLMPSTSPTWCLDISGQYKLLEGSRNRGHQIFTPIGNCRVSVESTLCYGGCSMSTQVFTISHNVLSYETEDGQVYELIANHNGHHLRSKIRYIQGVHPGYMWYPNGRWLPVDSWKITVSPTSSPTTPMPSAVPTFDPTTQEPTKSPSSSPTTDSPSMAPHSSSPSYGPTSSEPSTVPTMMPSFAPVTARPTFLPSQAPSSSIPTSMPSFGPTTSRPTFAPSQAPSSSFPTSMPSFGPTTSRPTFHPTTIPTMMPTFAPVTARPTFAPSQAPSSSIPTFMPSFGPTTSTTTTASESLVFDLRGRSGEEHVEIKVGGVQMHDIVLSQDWRRFEFTMPQNNQWSVDFKNDARGRDVYYRSDLLHTMNFRLFNNWMCGQRGENSRCRYARDQGTLAWRGEYVYTLEEPSGCSGTSVFASECARLSHPAQVSGNAVVIPNGNGNNGAGRIEFSIYCDADTQLNFLVEGFYPTGADDSYYVTLDNDYRRSWHIGASGQHWEYKSPPTLNTAKGFHSVKFEHREDGVSMRRVRIISTACRFVGNNECSSLVTDMYNTVLCREPDSSGFGHWNNMCESGMDSGEMESTFRNSEEYRGCATCQNGCVDPSHLNSHGRRILEASSNGITNRLLLIEQSLPF